MENRISQIEEKGHSMDEVNIIVKRGIKKQKEEQVVLGARICR